MRPGTTEHREALVSLLTTGCTDGGCVIRQRQGMHTNGGCHCPDEIAELLGTRGIYVRLLLHVLREVLGARIGDVAAAKEAQS